MDGLGADSEEKREPVRDIDTAVVDSLKVLDPNRPIREAEVRLTGRQVSFWTLTGHQPKRTASCCRLVQDHDAFRWGGGYWPVSTPSDLI
jgi:hypothetical protein